MTQEFFLLISIRWSFKSFQSKDRANSMRMLPPSLQWIIFIYFQSTSLKSVVFGKFFFFKVLIVWRKTLQAFKYPGTSWKARERTILNPWTSPLKSVFQWSQLSGSMNVQDGGITSLLKTNHGSCSNICLLYRLAILDHFTVVGLVSSPLSER